MFAKCDMIVKVKEPQPDEWAQLREGQILYTYLHLAPDPEQTKGLLESGVTAIAYETVTDDRGGLPLLAPMSRGRRPPVRSRPAPPRCRRPMAAAACCSAACPACCPARSSCIGGGVVGFNAAQMAAGLGADVTIIDRSIPRLRQLDDIFAGRVPRPATPTVEALEEECFAADIVIGAVLIPGAAAPKLVTREMLSA